jgi:antitoxin (DNA-binding transcriptional repressor) of toxin-antitoxin stability system
MALHLDRVLSGESFTITRSGRPAAFVGPVDAEEESDDRDD